MIKEETEIADLFFSEEEYLAEIAQFVDQHLKLLFKERGKFRQYCELFSEINGLKPYGILNAHGISREKQWVYQDNNKFFPVQNWIKAQDGNYGTLVLYVCNPGVHTPTSKKSLLWVPAGNVKLIGDAVRDFHFDLIDPEKGMIDSYTIDSDLEALEKSLESG